MDYTPEKAFRWNSPVTPERFQFQPSHRSKDESVTILLSDSPVLLKSKLHHRYQIFAVDRLVDHSEPSLYGFNLQQQIARFSSQKLNNHESFISLPSFLYEYKFQHQLTFNQCQTLCLFHKSTMVTSVDHIAELKTLIPRSPEYMWTRINQTFSKDDNYKVEFDLTEILPVNRFNGNSSTLLFHYHQGEYQPLSFADLHGRVKYYTYERDSYYSRQPHQLLARVNVHNQWQVLIPQWSGTQPSKFGKALCTCVRDLSLNLKNAQRASALAEEARYRTIRSPQKLEVQRVKKVSPSPSLSNVESILNDQQFYVPAERSYMRKVDLYDLRLEAGSSRDILSKDVSSNFTRRKRALPMAASLGLGVISKIVQFSLPYMLQDGKNFIRYLKRETGGFLLKAPKPTKSETNFQEYISSRFSSSPANFTVESDRLRIDMKNRQPSLRSLADPSLQQAQQLESASRQLKYIEENVLPYLPSILVHQIIEGLPFPIRPQSDILIRVQSSGTFSVIRYFFELHRHDLSYTEVQTFALPFKQVDQRFYAFSISNTTTLDITRSNKGRLRERQCLNAVLTTEPSNLASVCPVTEYKPQIYRKIFSLAGGSLLLFPGPSTIALDCFRHPAMKLSLLEQFNVLYLSSTCSASIIHQQISAVIPATAVHEDQNTYQILLNLEVPLLASQSQKLFYWMVFLSTSISIIFVIVVFIYLSMYFVKLKYKPKLSINSDGVIDVSIQNVTRKPSVNSDIIQLEDNPQTVSPITPCESQTPVASRPDPESFRASFETPESKQPPLSIPFLKKTKPAAH